MLADSSDLDEEASGVKVAIKSISNTIFDRVHKHRGLLITG